MFGRLYTETRPSGLTLKFNYTALGFLEQIRDLGTNEALFTLSGRNAEGQLTSATLGAGTSFNGIDLRQVYDPQSGRMISNDATQVGGAPTAVADFTYTYDKRGNLTQRRDVRLGLQNYGDGAL